MKTFVVTVWKPITSYILVEEVVLADTALDAASRGIELHDGSIFCGISTEDSDGLVEEVVI